MSELFPGELAKKIIAEDWAVISSGDVRTVEEDLNGRNYTTIKFPIVQGHRTLLAGYTIDITERKQAEETLAEANSFTLQMIQSAKDGIVVYGLDLRIQVWNPFMEELTGKLASEVIGNHPLDLFPFHKETGLIERLEKVLSEGGADTSEFPYHIPELKKEGWACDISSPLLDAQGEIIGVIGIVRDITERKQAEEQQAQLLQKLSEINQELKDFAYVVSHDLKAPLRAIKALADWLSTDYQDKLDEQGKENLRLLGSRVDRMHNLIDGVLQYSRIGRTEQETAPVDLNRLVPEIIDGLGAPEHVAIHVEPDLPTVEADATRITQVFQNLLSNAVKYMDKPQGNITVGCAEDDGFWTFSVADNGPGIEKKDFERIFKLFQTLASRDTCESTGVGLTVVKKIVEMYGGRIWVESEVGQGTTFFFTFPKQTEAAVPECLEVGAAP